MKTVAFMFALKQFQLYFNLHNYDLYLNAYLIKKIRLNDNVFFKISNFTQHYNLNNLTLGTPTIGSFLFI